MMPDLSENGLFGTPDYDQIEDESFPPLPPPFSPGERNFDEESLASREGEEGDVSKLPDVPVAKRRMVRRPQPKLDSQRLLSDRGLPALRTLFDDVKFKGKGQEAEDLKVLMQKMENWAHRLFPKLQFEDFIDRLEFLGGKKDVQTCLKRIRLDMPLTHEDYVGTDQYEEEQVHVQDDEDLFGDGGLSEDPFIHSTPALVPVSLTDEQQQRIERNKQLARERRLARQTQQEFSQPAFSDEPAENPTEPHLSQDHQDEHAGETLASSSQSPPVPLSSLLCKSGSPAADQTAGGGDDSD